MELLYLYGIVHRADRLSTTLDPRLGLVSHGGLSALVEPVDGEQFSPPVLDSKLHSLQWVTAQASAHQAVLARVMRERPVVPARLCTMFSGPSALQARLEQQEHRFLALLDAIEGREEWSVKVFGHRAMLERDIAARDGLDRPAEPSAAPGRAFLLRKRRRMELARLVDEAIDDCVDEVLECVEDLAFDIRLRALLSEQTTGRADAMMLNVAALLDRGADDALARVLDKASEYHGERFSMELSGPWPPYSFCDEPERPAAIGQEGIDVQAR